MGSRLGHGFNVPKPKRRICPSCGKKGVTMWKLSPTGIDLCGCQFCGDSWTRAAWAIEQPVLDQARASYYAQTPDGVPWESAPQQSRKAWLDYAHLSAALVAKVSPANQTAQGAAS